MPITPRSGGIDGKCATPTVSARSQFARSTDRFVRALVSPVSALLRARRRTGGRTWCRGGCQLHLALGAGLCTRTEQTLPTASQADQQELSDRRDLYKG